MKYVDFDKTEAFKKLSALPNKGKDFNALLSAERVKTSKVSAGGGLSYSWAAKGVEKAELDALQALADEQDLIGKYKALLDGEIINTGENRKVLHHLLRGQGGLAVTGKAVIADGKDLGKFYAQELERFSTFAELVQAGKIKGATGKNFSSVVQIGIGGSDLGPRALYLALENWAAKEGKSFLKARFISNVDPDDASQVASLAPLDETIFVLVSKSGTTQETLSNELFIKDKLQKAGLDPSKHIVAVTSETSPLARNPAYLDSFYIDDFIGGRYSATSGVGGVILSLAFGPGVFKELLAGAHEADTLALEPNILKNAALLDALIGVWERNFLGYPYTAILPYSQGLSRFPAHLQQLDMESNGKRVNRDGSPVHYSTGPVVFGEPGTNGQHSFFQLLHQGTDIVPLQFVGFTDSQRNDDVSVDGSVSQTKLKANLAAQIVAFAKGKADSNGNKEFLGGRPSSLIYGKRLDPKALGALLAHFENKVMFQGFVWNLNSFDQEGVQLGKILTKKVLSGNSGDAALDAYSEILGVK
ncbi:glucose-6-phosphate isomerase [Treponema primitia]|uniref:glucose-6-phosphate isomerase n=1 Tax=Treponema primitia TaxID=88058 RepID=UPI0002554D00|nr:glucose-6-phosphate isomerase [Treponema primitia]